MIATVRSLKLLVLASAIVLSALSGGARADGDAARKPGTSQITSNDVKRVLDRLQRHYKDTNAFSAKFNQEIATVGAPKRERAGTVWFRKPGRMRWDFTSPEQQTIVSDGETLFSYDPDLNQVVKTPLREALKSSSSATSFLLGMGNLSRDFNARLSNPARPDGLIHLALDPKSEGGGYKIELGLEPKSYDLVTLTLTDQLGDVTRVKFSSIQDNVHIADSIFAFEVPAGADVVVAPSSH